jgi:hypothetical protein
MFLLHLSFLLDSLLIPWSQACTTMLLKVSEEKGEEGRVERRRWEKRMEKREKMTVEEWEKDGRRDGWKRKEREWGMEIEWRESEKWFKGTSERRKERRDHRRGG